MPLIVVCLVPAAPVLLPRLTGSRVPEVAPVRAAVRRAMTRLVDLDRVVVVTDDSPGTLAGFGAATTSPRVGEVDGDGAADGSGPAGVGRPSWPRELADALLDGADEADEADEARTRRGREHRSWAQVTPDLLRELDGAPERVGLLLLADGSRTRGAKAPGGQDARGDVVDAELLAALEQGRAADVPDASLVGASAEAAVALLAVAPGGPTRVLHHEAPLGVAYLVALRCRADG